MKKNIITFLTLLCVAVLVASCENDLPSCANFSSYEFSGLDKNGGTWKPVLLSSPTQIVLAEPAIITSSAYLAELASLKSITASLNGTQVKEVCIEQGKKVTQYIVNKAKLIDL